MKTFTLMIALLLISDLWPLTSRADPSAADWQNISLGTTLTVDCPSKKVASLSGKNARKDGYDYLDVNITVKNNQENLTAYNLDVLFLARGKDNKIGEGICQRDKKTTPISLDAGTSTNLSFHASDVYYGEKISVAWIGYIVRLSAYGRPIKTIASDKALEKLAADPEKMKLLESGKIVPAK